MEDIVKALDPIFKPKSIAVIGASNDLTKWGYRMVYNPIYSGYSGPIYPINLGEKKIAGLKAYPSLLKVPEDIDLAVIVVPAPIVPQVMEECVEKEVKGAIIISAGFAETGNKGKALQEKVLRIAERGGVKFVGPNCNGIWSADVRLNLALWGELRSGPVSFISQSGTFGAFLTMMAMAHGYGINNFVHMGNEASLTELEYLQYFAEDTNTKVIACYIEGLRKGREFFKAAKEIVKKKPIVLYKAGRTPAGSRAMLSHTASVSGVDEIFEAACKQAGIIRVYEAFHPFILAEALVKQPLPRRNRVTVIGGGGGYCVSTSDICSVLGLSLPEFDEETKRKLKEVLPSHASTPRNPIDTAADWRPETYRKLIEIVANLDYIDGIIIQLPPWHWWTARMRVHSRLTGPTAMAAFLREIIDTAEKIAIIPEKYGKPTIVTILNPEEADPVVNVFQSAGLPLYETPEDCARAMYGLAKYAEIRRKLEVDN
ncbi:MAG: CoA-binding protein [Candidatus Bathyarchaeota archaeon]|nr:CoA-binding protein [Candidatus Bathyarchaeota archaeon]MDH5624452.1 CoA-binding protein [Candidatus Bathyarchaeota archaeon]